MCLDCALAYLGQTRMHVEAESRATGGKLEGSRLSQLHLYTGLLEASDSLSQPEGDIEFFSRLYTKALSDYGKAWTLQNIHGKRFDYIPHSVAQSLKRVAPLIATSFSPNPQGEAVCVLF
jgi:hypothetical protein